MRCSCSHCGADFDAEPEEGHRLLCGDSTRGDDVARLLGSARPALCLTDPPYGLGDSVTRKNDYISHDDSPANLDRIIAGFFPLAQKACGLVVVTPGNSNQTRYPMPTWTMAWFTPAGTGRGPWGFCCWQPIMCFGKDPKLSRGLGAHPDAIVHTESAEKNGHPCPKPIRFWSWLVERTSEAGAEIYDPFSGSGTTIMAAETTGRRAYAIDIEPAYVDVSVRRWQDFTGRAAVREADGGRFP